jgi:hypothetical protein
VKTRVQDISLTKDSVSDIIIPLVNYEPRSMVVFFANQLSHDSIKPHVPDIQVESRNNHLYIEEDALLGLLTAEELPYDVEKARRSASLQGNGMGNTTVHSTMLWLSYIGDYRKLIASFNDALSIKM